jgi:hypothetical protein
MSRHAQRRPLGRFPARRGPEDFRAWRARRLQAAGFDHRLALCLASDNRIDLHALLELTDRGCPPDLAARIMAPLTDVPPDDAGALRQVSVAVPPTGKTAS